MGLGHAQNPSDSVALWKHRWQHDTLTHKWKTDPLDERGCVTSTLMTRSLHSPCDLHAQGGMGAKCAQHISSQHLWNLPKTDRDIYIYIAIFFPDTVYFLHQWSCHITYHHADPRSEKSFMCPSTMPSVMRWCGSARSLDERVNDFTMSILQSHLLTLKSNCWTL